VRRGHSAYALPLGDHPALPSHSSFRISSHGSIIDNLQFSWLNTITEAIVDPSVKRSESESWESEIARTGLPNGVPVIQFA